MTTSPQKLQIRQKNIFFIKMKQRTTTIKIKQNQNLYKSDLYQFTKASQHILVSQQDPNSDNVSCASQYSLPQSGQPGIGRWYLQQHKSEKDDAELGVDNTYVVRTIRYIDMKIIMCQTELLGRRINCFYVWKYTTSWVRPYPACLVA